MTNQLDKQGQRIPRIALTQSKPKAKILSPYFTEIFAGGRSPLQVTTSPLPLPCGSEYKQQQQQQQNCLRSIKSKSETKQSQTAFLSYPHAKNDKIFVSIAAYRDPECQHTILNLFQTALRPERIIVGVVWQVQEKELQRSDFE